MSDPDLSHSRPRRAEDRRVLEATAGRRRRSSVRRSGWIAGALVLVLAVGGIVVLVATGSLGAPADATTAPDSSGASTPSRVPERTSSPSATAAVPATASTDPADWLVTEDGMGPLILGAPYADARENVPDATACRGEAGDPATGFGGRLWITPSTDDGSATLQDVAWERYDLDAVDFAVGPRTTEGIGLGSTVEEVRATYPTAVSVMRNTEYLQVGRIYFTVGEGFVNGIGVTTADAPWEYCG